MNLKDYRKAIEDLTSVIKYNPDNAYAYYLRGKLYYKHGDYTKGEFAKGIADLKKAAAMGIEKANKILNEAKNEAGE